MQYVSFYFRLRCVNMILNSIINEFQIRKNTSATFSHVEEKPLTWRDKIKGFFRG